MKIAMIPARMGSQRLKRKNMRELHGVPLITLAIRKCLAAGVFDEVSIVRISRPNTLEAEVSFQIKITAEPVFQDEEPAKGASRRR